MQLSVIKNFEELAIGRFLLAPLRLRKASPEIFHLAIIAASDKECIDMISCGKPDGDRSITGYIRHISRLIHHLSV